MRLCMAVVFSDLGCLARAVLAAGLPVEVRLCISCSYHL